MKSLLIILSSLIVMFLLFALLTIYRIKRKIDEIDEALIDIKNGNGNRRILVKRHEIMAPIVYQINDIVQEYENRLATLRLEEEIHKQLMTSLSHDVRTPLTTLIGYLDAAHKGIVVGNEREEYLEIARRKSHDLKEYIDVLFDWFKLNSNEYSMEITTVEIVEQTRDMLIDWIAVLENNRIDYSIEIPEQAIFVRLNPEGYMRILNNLLQNVVAHSHADRVVIELSQQECNVCICISDNGIGIEKEDLKYIFERLYKCDKGRSEKGSGLGLSIVRQLVEKMGGKITVESTKGKGTTFMLLFPLSP